MKGPNRYMKILLVAFLEKIWFEAIWSFRSFFTVWLGMVKIEHDHCDYWILKLSQHDFLDKHLCDGYCMDIMWCLSLEVKIQLVHMVL